MYFFPWGEKSLKNLIDYILDFDMLSSQNGIPTEHLTITKVMPSQYHNNLSWIKCIQPIVVCHDQEPLDFDLYKDGSKYAEEIKDFLEQQYNVSISPENQQLNLRYPISSSWQKYWLLLHSELNSDQVKKYESTGRFIGAYWWSHAIIARDWYRFAQHDQRLLEKNKKQTLFLIYSRDTTGSRNYRGKFLSKISLDLAKHCQVGSFRKQKISSESSAEYDAFDFVNSSISIVLETIFDDNRIHLTEKILRPIACGHPFILAAGPGSLDLLRKYGFKTFHPWIDESYDTVIDPDDRIEHLIKEMKRLADLSQETLDLVLSECQVIADHNKNRFFSDKFFNQVIDELKNNIQHAHQKSENKLDIEHWINDHFWKNGHRDIRSIPEEIKNIIEPLLEQYQGHQHRLDDKSGTDGHDV